MMKALTIWQPWASLIAFSEKRIETRSWRTDYRGPLVIHASKWWTPEQRAHCWQSPFAQALLRHGVRTPNDLPLGQVLCVVQLVDVGPVQQVRPLTEQERAFGDYSPGRYAWRFDRVQLVRPHPAVGRQGLWKCSIALRQLEFESC